MSTLKRGLALAAAGLAILAAASAARDEPALEPQSGAEAQRTATTFEPRRTQRTQGNPAREASASSSAYSAASSLSASSASIAVSATDLAHQIENEDDHVTALELAQWIRERKAGLRVIDIRSETEFDAYHIPSAERIPLATLATLKPAEGETLVLYSEGGAHAAQGWVLLRSAGHRQVFFLRGGLLDWMEDVMSPSLPTDTSRARIAALSRYFGGVPRTGAVPIAGAPATSAAEAVARVRRRGC